MKRLFWQSWAGEAAERKVGQQLQVLQANFRNTQAVADRAHRLLKIKPACFASIASQAALKPSPGAR